MTIKEQIQKISISMLAGYLAMFFFDLLLGTKEYEALIAIAVGMPVAFWISLPKGLQDEFTRKALADLRGSRIGRWLGSRNR